MSRINRGKVHRVAGQLPYQIPVDGRYGVVADRKNSAALKYPPDGIRNPAVHIRTELLLVETDLVKGRLIAEGPDINNILLEEAVKGEGHHHLPSPRM